MPLTSPDASATAVHPALAALLMAQEASALASDTLVEAFNAGAHKDVLTDLVERARVAQLAVGDATAAAAACPLPAGGAAAELVGYLKGCNARIRAGANMAEKILSLQGTVDLLGKQFVLQAIANLAPIAAWPSVAGLRDAFRGRPAVIVAAGPSLDKNIDVVRHFQGKAIILSVSHALLALHRAGITPDMCVAADPQDLRYHFAKVPPKGLGALVLGTSVLPELFELPARRFFTFAANPAIDGWVYKDLEDCPPISSASSVATCAFSLALHFGCNPIILVGQDLSFPDGRHYATSLDDGRARVDVSADGRLGVVRDISAELHKLGGSAAVLIRDVPGYYGGRVQTSFSFHVARTWFIETTASLQGSRSILNCTEGGAYIDGMEHVPLAEAAARYATADAPVAEVLDRVIASMDPEARRKLVLGRVESMMAALEACRRRTRLCIKLAEDGKRRPDLMKKLSAAEVQLSESVEAIGFVSALVQREIRSALDAGKNAKNAAQGLDASLQVYAAVMRTLTTIHEPLVRSKQMLERPWRPCMAPSELPASPLAAAQPSTGTCDG